jgi:aspartyl-tRNA(Asn)/glutamyl-tRNA(Gln) amidotransferase subunit A
MNPEALTPSGPTLAQLAHGLATGKLTARGLVEDCLTQIEDAAGQGSIAFLSVDSHGARLAADAMDRLRQTGAEPSPFAGIPLSVKDLFDIEGEVTRAGSRVLERAPPAGRTASAVQRLRAAGFIVIGRTNMTEFAFSGLGLNPHFGTPLGPWNRAEMRVAGGSSSGAAASVADGMAHGALGTDTGGSCRIPAAFCGLVGFKPTAARVPRDGVLPLSTSLDSVGTIARSVSCCRLLDGVLAAEATSALAVVDLSVGRALVPTTLVMDELQPIVAASFERALKLLSGAGLRISEAAMPELARIPEMNAKGGFAAAESWGMHSTWIEGNAADYDPRVLSRIRRGMQQSAADYISLVTARTALIAEIEARLKGFDFVLMPTVPTIPPRLQDLETDTEYYRINMLALRNPTVINMIDGCAMSLPMHRLDEPPTGLMIAAVRGRDRKLLNFAVSIEECLAKRDGV